MSDRLATERLRLEPISLEHADLLVELDSDPEVMRYLTGGRPSSRSEVEQSIAASLGHRWVVFDRSTDRFVGWFALRPAADDEVELGYRLRREWWGRGLATEGGRFLVRRGFDELGARRVFAQTMAVNERSRRVMEACGLRYTRTFHLEWEDPIDGTELGEVEYELTRDEYRARRA